MPTSKSSKDVPQEILRVLIGWAPNLWSAEARSSFISATPEEHLQEVLACKAKVAVRPSFSPGNPINEIEENDLVVAIKARPEYAYLENEVINLGGRCRIAMVNLAELIAIQPQVRVDNLENMGNPPMGNPPMGNPPMGNPLMSSFSNEELYQFCFPASTLIAPDEATIERAGNGYTITTLDPNIRLVPWHSIPGAAGKINYQLRYPTASSPFEMQLFPYSLLKIPNYFQVVHYQDRYVLKNGYSRALNLLSHNIQNIPCILTETNNHQLIGLRSGMFDLGTVLSMHPPRLPDFLDDTVTCLMKRTALRYVYHVSMNMMLIPR